MKTQGAVVIIHDGTQVVLVRSIKRDGWEFPGGKLEEGEDYTQAGKREFQEETNGDIDNVPLGLLGYVEHKGVDVALLIGKVKAPFPVSAGDGTSAASWVPWDEICAELDHGTGDRFTRIFMEGVTPFRAELDAAIGGTWKSVAEVSESS